MIPGMIPVTPPTRPRGYEFVSAANKTVAATTFTYTAQNIGEADPNRLVVVCICMDNNGVTRSLSSVTIAGAAATIVADTGSSDRAAAIVAAAVPNGTTADIVVTYSGNVNLNGIGVFAMYALNSNTAVSTASPGGAAATTTITGIQAGDFCIASGEFSTGTSGITAVSPTILASSVNVAARLTSSQGYYTATSTSHTLGFSSGNRIALAAWR